MSDCITCKYKQVEREEGTKRRRVKMKGRRECTEVRLDDGTHARMHARAYEGGAKGGREGVREGRVGGNLSILGISQNCSSLHRYLEWSAGVKTNLPR